MGFPGWGRGVIVPTSINPNPNAPKQSIKSPFLSSPAAVPRRFEKVIPPNICSSFLYFLVKDILM